VLVLYPFKFRDPVSRKWWRYVAELRDQERYSSGRSSARRKFDRRRRSV
jgi:hypothetical protein